MTHAEYMRDWRKRNPERAKEANRRFYVRNRERVKKQTRAYYYANRDRICVSTKRYRDANFEKIKRSKAEWCRLRKYGVKDIGETCAVCDSTRLLGIDHCHTTGKVRGTLCRKCNAALGMVGDSVEMLNRLVSYLELFR